MMMVKMMRRRIRRTVLMMRIKLVRKKVHLEVSKSQGLSARKNRRKMLQSLSARRNCRKMF